MFSDYIELHIRDEGLEIEEHDLVVGAVDSSLTFSYNKALKDLKNDIMNNKGIYPELEPERFQQVYSARVLELHKEYVGRIPEMVESYAEPDNTDEEDEDEGL